MESSKKIDAPKRHSENPNEKYYVRLAKESDLNPICIIENSCFLPGVAESAEVLFSRIKSGNLFLLCEKESDSIIGYISMDLWKFEMHQPVEKFGLNKISSYSDPEGTEINYSSFAILPAKQGKGSGSFFFNAVTEILMKKYPQAQSTVLICSSEWPLTIEFYKKHGYEEVMRYSGFFKPPSGPQDGIVFRKIIRPNKIKAAV